MNPKTAAKLKQIVAIAAMMGKLTMEEVQAINLIIDRIVKEKK